MIAPWLGRLAAHPASWLGLSVLCAVADYATGPTIQFPALYLLPVVLAAWYRGRTWGVTLAVVLPLVRLAMLPLWSVPWTPVDAAVNAAIRLVVFVALAGLVERTAQHVEALRRTHVLEGLLGVCAICKRIHNEPAGEWQTLDAYVASRPFQAGAGICPGCRTHVADVFDRR